MHALVLLQSEASGPGLVRLVVDRAAEVLIGLRRMPRNKAMVLPDISVGLTSKVDSTVQLLTSGSSNQMVLLHGMAGIGKTTLAKAVFNTLHAMDNTVPCHFARLNPEMMSPEDVVDEQRAMLKELAYCVSRVSDIRSAASGRQMLQQELQGKQVLLVVDNAWKQQLHWLLPDNIMGVLGDGSMVLVTSRESWASEEEGESVLSEAESMELFCQHAYGSSCCPAKDQVAVSAIVARCGGLPLALEVVGRHLAETRDAWKFFRHIDDSLAYVYSHQRACRFERQQTVFEALSVSWDALDEEQRETLLDVVWFLQGQPRPLVESLCDPGVLEQLNRLGLVRWKQAEGGAGKQLVVVHAVLMDFCKMLHSSKSGMRLEMEGDGDGDCSVDDILSMVGPCHQLEPLVHVLGCCHGTVDQLSTLFSILLFTCLVACDIMHHSLLQCSAGAPHSGRFPPSGCAKWTIVCCLAASLRCMPGPMQW
jgi:hypothetical protein